MTRLRYRQIGVVVDGHSEFHSLPEIVWPASGGDVRLVVRLASALDPKAAMAKQVRACSPIVRELAGRRVERVVVLLDREDRAEAALEIESRLAAELARANQLPAGVQLHVVCKDIAYENWLYADPEVFRACSARFSALGKRAARPDAQVDGKPVKTLLESACRKRSYDKVGDAKLIASRMDVERASRRSESFSRFASLVAKAA